MNMQKSKIDLKVRRLIRKIVGAHKNCPISLSTSSDTFPIYSGLPYNYEFGGAIWTTYNGRHTPSFKVSYKRSTQKIEIGVNVVNEIKSLFTIKSRGKYKLEIDNNTIDIPNLALGRYIIRNNPDKTRNIKIVK